MMRLRHARWPAATIESASAAWFLVLAAATLVVAGDEPSPPDGERPLSYRRIYAPADRMQDWPTGEERFLPVDAGELDQLLEHARRHAMNAPVDGVPYVQSARFEASLEGVTLREGRAELDVVYDGDSESLLLMDGVTLAMGSPAWNSDPATPAVAGRWSDGLFGVLVRNTGTLVFPWSQRGARDMAGNVRFRFRLPRSVQRELQLTLPSGLVPHVDHGVAVSGPTDRKGQSVWRLRLGPEPTITLRILDRPLDDAPRSDPLQSLIVYDIAPEGMSVTASFSISVPDQQDAELRLSLAAPLKTTAVLLDGQHVPWRAISDPATEDRQLLVELQRKDDVRRKKLVVQALLPIRLNRLVRLPQVRVPGAEWESGGTRIFINDPLEMTRLELDGCIQVDSQPRAAPRSGDSLELADYRPDASVEIQLARHQPGSQWEHASTVVVGPDEATSTTTLRWTGAADRYHLITPRIDPDWVITQVYSEPRGLVRFWDLDQTDAASPRVVIGWDADAAPRDGALIRLTGRRVWTPTRGALWLGDLSMLTRSAWRTRAPLLGLRAAEPYRLHVEGSSPLDVVTDANMPSDEADLLDSPQRMWFVRCNREATQCRLSLIRRTPAFQADVRLEFLVDRAADVLRERYAVRCVPQSSGVDRFHIHFHGAEVADLQWDIPGGQAHPVALPVSEQDSKASGGKDETAWEIVLDQPRRAPFTVTAHRRRASPRGWRMPLVSVPDARAAEARIVVRSECASGVGIRAAQLERIENERLASDRFSDVRATFAYDATSEGIALSQGSLVLDAQGNRRLPAPACVWDATLFSKVAEHGDTVHTVTYAVHNLGRETMGIALPPKTTLQAVWSDGKPVAIHQAVGGNDSVISLDLPQQRQCNVVLQYQELGHPLGTVHWIASAFPSIDMPVLSRRWTVWLPPPYVALRKPHNLVTQRESLLRRLLGPLAGKDEQGPSSTTQREFDYAAWQNDAIGAGSVAALTQIRPPGNLVSWGGWHAGGASAGVRGIAVVNEQRIFLLGLGLFALYTTLFAVYLNSVRFRIVLFFATAILALLLPAAVVPLVTAAFLGALAGQGLRLILSVGARQTSDEANDRVPSGKMPQIAVGGPAMLVALLFAAAAGYAAEPPGQKPPSTTYATDAKHHNKPTESDPDDPVYRIWIPVDDEPNHPIFSRSTSPRWTR